MSESMSSSLLDQLPFGYRIDRRFGAVYARPPAAADDLTLIRGVDTREAVTLNRLGVYFLGQIALWQHDEIAAYADELGMSASDLRDEQWVHQAQVLSRPHPVPKPADNFPLPASIIRTVSLLACALLVGCMVVYWLSLRANQPLYGTLAADITSLKVPTEARLIVSHVRAGDEVFSGDALLTLEKTEHLAMISVQEHRVRQLEQELQKAEAQASLDLEWRTREVDRELSDVRTRAHLIQEVKRVPVGAFRSASVSEDVQSERHHGSGRRRSIMPISQTHVPLPARRGPNSLVFISGVTGESSFVAPPPAPLSIPPENKIVLTSEPSSPAVTEEILSVEARTVEARLARLEQLRTSLPVQVRHAAGVEGIRAQLDDAAARLNEMQTLSRQVEVVCPAHGKVGQVRYKTGDHMMHGEVMLKILHTDRRFVMAFIPTRRLNEVEPGMIVDVVFPGNERCRGKIANLPMLAEVPSTGGQSLASVRIEPVGRLWPEIPIGSQIDVVVASSGVL